MSTDRSKGEGVASIGKADSELKLFTTILNWHKSDVMLCEQSAKILLSLAGYGKSNLVYRINLT